MWRRARGAGGNLYARAVSAPGHAADRSADLRRAPGVVTRAGGLGGGAAIRRQPNIHAGFRLAVPSAEGVETAKVTEWSQWRHLDTTFLPSWVPPAGLLRRVI